MSRKSVKQMCLRRVPPQNVLQEGRRRVSNYAWARLAICVCIRVCIRVRGFHLVFFFPFLAQTTFATSVSIETGLSQNPQTTSRNVSPLPAVSATFRPGSFMEKEITMLIREVEVSSDTSMHQSVENFIRNMVHALRSGHFG